MTKDAWVPDQYHRFAAQRSQPFHDLLAMVEPAPSGSAVDLGCGSGELTALLADHTQTTTLGVDSSAAMLEQAARHTRAGLSFLQSDLREPPPGGPFDVIFSNAALQWVPDHADVLTLWRSWLKPGGQLAVQVPANVDHPSHRVSAALAQEEPWASEMADGPPPDPVLSVLPPEVYAGLLHQLGFVEQQVRLQVYPHVLDSSADVVEWVKGTSLTRFARALPPDRYEAFVAEYRDRLLGEIGDRSPYFYGFKRILMWGRLAS